MSEVERHLLRFTRILKSSIPPPLRPPLRVLKNAILGSPRDPLSYENRVRVEIGLQADPGVHELPAIASYWSTRHLVPMIQPLGFTNSIELFRSYIARVCRSRPAEACALLSIGSGEAAAEINMAQWLIENGIGNFTFDCMDISPQVLERGRLAAREHGFGDRFTFAQFDVNTWTPARRYDVVLAIQSLHHFVELELLFDKIHTALDPAGFFLPDDMIGRNGHQRWPEALRFVLQFWRELPDRYKHNRQLHRLERKFENKDYSVDGFEGIRAQDILPLLIERFHFHVFVGFGNIIDIFIDRGYGPNFDPQNEWDRDFIDRIHAADMREIEAGRVKPTHMYAVMAKFPADRPQYYKHLTPEFCVRRPGRSMFSGVRALFSAAGSVPTVKES